MNDHKDRPSQGLTDVLGRFFALSRFQQEIVLAGTYGYCPEAVTKALAGEEQARPAPVITDSERDCDQANPASGAWCHRSGPHTEHRDTDGETWTTAGETPAAVAS